MSELAESQNTYADNLRRQPARKWAALGQMCAYQNKARYPLKTWSEAASFLLGCPVCFENYEQIENSLKPFSLNVR